MNIIINILSGIFLFWNSYSENKNIWKAIQLKLSIVWSVVECRCGGSDRYQAYDHSDGNLFAIQIIKFFGKNNNKVIYNKI